ncbi:MAG: transglutaminase domain-containing protein [Bdellovibrionia bacterium]
MFLRKKLIGPTLSLATLSLLVASPSFAGSIFDAFNSVLNSLPANSSDSYQAPPLQEQSFSRGLSTSDSSYLFSANFPSGTALVHIQIEFSDQTKKPLSVYASATGGNFSRRVYLPYGPGNYRIKAWYSQNPNRYQSSSEQAYYGQVDVTNTDTRDLSYLLPSGDVQSDDPEIVALARDITAGASSDSEKAQRIHDWITHNIAYDTDSYFRGTYKTKSVDALTTLHEGVSICNGYANLYAALARASGLRTRVIIGAIIWPMLGQTWEQTGTTQTHAWNQVFIDGHWVILDSTWDSGNVDFDKRVFVRDPKLKYYDPSLNEFAKDHRQLSVSSN